MRLVKRGQKRLMKAGVVSFCLLSFLAVGLFKFATPVHAAWDQATADAAWIAAAAAEGLCLDAGLIPVTCPQKGIKQVLEIVGEKIVAPAFRIALIQALLNLSQFVLNRLAFEAAVAIASGGPGEDSLFYNQTPSEAFGQLGLEIAGEAIGSMSQLSTTQLGIKFNLCQPSMEGLQLALSLGIKQKYQPSKPKCDILEIASNWEAFGASIYQQYLDPEERKNEMLKTLASTLKPGQNELTATLRINIAVDQDIQEQKLLQFAERNKSTYKPVTDFLTGNIKTPSETLQADFEEALKNSKKTGEQIRVGELANAGELIGGLALSTASTFTNALLSKLLDRIYSGLFDTATVNPFDLEALGSGDKEAAQERFASIITTNPIATTEYDALSEFVVCTAEGTINRMLNSCVMDVNFLAAVNRGTAGQPLTVQEAIDEGLLNGDWPLISPDNMAANQDPFCYTYGYCYGNLVKLRKARVLPIGWELAAQRNSESNPATLQEIIDGFNDCTQDGTIRPEGKLDGKSKWCHLIDPNWVLRYPETQCRAVGNGEIRISTLTPGRNSQCVDTPSCIGEDNDGNCVDGYGYCVQEKNVWRFRGEECPQEYATCLSFSNTQSGDDGDFLVSTVDYSVCDQDNAGCRWYRTNKYVEDAGTEDPNDDSYEWLAQGDDYVVAKRDANMNYTSGSGAVGRTIYSYTSDSTETYTYEQYAYEDRLYLTNNATQCSDQDVGCTQLYEFDDSLYLNTVRNPSFEDDQDEDGTPDGWVALGGAFALDTSVLEFGSSSVALTPDSTMHLEQFVDVADQNFYTFSAYFQAETSGATGLVHLLFLDEDGVEVSAAGSSSDGDCTWNSTNLWYEMSPAPSTSEFELTQCLFTVPEGTQQIRVSLGKPDSSPGKVYVDAVQLELGEDANIFSEGYSGARTPVYYQVAPDYLGCTGAQSDPAECDSYAQVCSAQEVGCSLYTPEDGDPNVPAIISELDECPSECVGYTTYKQEATAYESESFPLYFIADSASSCAQQYVGCDSYTNLGTVEAGGEGIEYYTDLRFCLSRDIADATSPNTTPATYFTWEGSDNEGYQLQTWNLLQSNYSGSLNTFVDSGFEETDPELAPCTHISMTSENVVVCDEAGVFDLAVDVWENADCDEHDDIFENPDCREFFDTQGNIHYRQYSETISISDECTAYRKDVIQETDCNDSGGFWTDQGFCRYYVLPQESTQCPAEQNGCREYTGGTGRNATTILDETFEGGTYEDFVMASLSNYPNEISISNESVATQGHSLYVLAPSSSSGMAGVETAHIYLDSTATTETYDEEGDAAGTSTTCTSNGGTIGDSGCDITQDVNADGSDDEDCSVIDGQESCGALTSSLVGGKTFVLEFWAKGNGNLYVTFEEEGGSGTSHDFVNPETTISSVSDLTPVVLDGAWALYTLGPVDTSSYEDFDENAVVRFATDTGMEFYLDNIALKQVEENITIIKDSWVVPSTCDQTPEGVDSDQYYLGCEAYTDHNGSDVDLYQFSDLCSEEVVGCDGFYQTANSESPYTQIYNARCVYSTNMDLTDEEFVGTNTTCEVNGIQYCTISAGEGYCTFDTDQAFPGELPMEEVVSSALYYAIVFGPETVVVSGDVPVYIVEDDSFACTSSVMGCQELGEPVYVQDQSEVESFESVYYINLPGDYDNILCSNEALFCEEWESTQNGNFYFKDPLDKECEYKTSVTINSRAYFGWFRTGTTEPCYWTDVDGDGTFDYGEEDAYLIAGEEFGVWTNGDEDDSDDDTWDYYDGWVASCDGKYDLCTEFIDVVDTGGGLNENGQSYYFTNDELLSEDTLQDSQRCNGQVSQKFGCALFNNTTVSELSYNASASYVLSTHADVFYGTQMNDLVDPISCTTEDGGVFEISSADAALAGTDTNINLCARRCEYSLQSGDFLTTSGTEVGSPGSPSTTYYAASCFMDADCAVLTTYNGEEVTGTCADVSTDVSSGYVLEDDSNEVLKVARDRTCSAWLACESSRTSWNTTSNKYDTICDSINLCVEGQQQGDRAMCSQWDERDSTILSAYQYSARDVSWTGYEYSGVSIPNQLPIELYDQFNIAAESVCSPPPTSLSCATDVGACEDAYGDDGVCGEDGLCSIELENDLGLPLACGSFEDCPASSQTCVSDTDCINNGYGACNASTGTCFYACTNGGGDDYRLVYNAGPCDSTQAGDGNGGSCTVGHCEDSGSACADDGDCAQDDACVVGYLQATGSVNCENEGCSCDPDENGLNDTNADCDDAESLDGIDTPVCDPASFVCVDELTTSQNEARDPCVESSDDRSCVPVSSSTVGSCFNNRCLADIRDGNGDGYADRLEMDDAREQTCRAYPEVDSPFPPEVVTLWMQYSDANIGPGGTPPISADSEPISSALNQAATPYTFVNGFQDSTTCAIDENGDPVDCICSYDKAEYGEGTGYRYFEQGTGIDGVPDGICSGGPMSGIPCMDDRDCTVDEQSGTCSYVSRVDSVYGWSGYCIEKDTSIQTLGSSDPEDQACLSWLPVDQLTGATDLYAKYTSAGFEPQNTYYCAEVDIAYGIGTTEIACAETQDANCNDHSWEKIDDDGYAGFKEEAIGTHYEDDCVAAVWCPEGYFAVMGGCGAQKSANVPYCDDDGLADMDCPFFCVPKLSYKTGDAETIGVKGDLCLDPYHADGLGFTLNSDPYVDTAYELNTRDIGDYKNIYGNEAPEIQIYVLKADQFDQAWEFYDDCFVRGVTDGLGQYLQPKHDINELLPTLGSATKGYYGMSWDYRPSSVCTEIVRVSEKSLEEDNEEVLDFDTYNAAWTNRLWKAPSSTNGYDLSSAGIVDPNNYFGYRFNTFNEPFGAATDFENLSIADDPSPHEVVMCEKSTFEQELPPADTLSCATGYGPSSSLGEDARAYIDFSLDVDSQVDENWCHDLDCGCSLDDFPDPISVLDPCNWDGGANISCNGLCVGGDEDGKICSTDDNNTDCEDASDPGVCVGTCVGGPYNGVACGTNSGIDCTPNVCHVDNSGGGVCYLQAEGLSYTLNRTEDAADAVSRLSQLFGRIYGIAVYSDGYTEDTSATPQYMNVTDVNLSSLEAYMESRTFGTWKYLNLNVDESEFSSGGYSDWKWDTRGARANAEKYVPKVMSVGDCEGIQCYEGVEGKFSVNGVDSADIEGEGSERVTVSFYAYADNEQMPIRRVIVDWGDNVGGIVPSSNTWPFGSYSGSIAPDNFYKNHRGLDPVSDTEECSATTTEFGSSPDACSSSYIAFTHDYTCTRGRLDLIDRECTFADDGRLINSPCVKDDSYCVFQPRVHVMDNWGWCTGTCTAGDDGTEGCYTGVLGDGVTKVDECNIQECPSEGRNSFCDDYDVNSDGIFDTVNPWVNYDGAIYILAE